jgi:RuvB-like protein 1 (pontin 52)
LPTFVYRIRAQFSPSGRYAVQLLTPAHVLSEINGHSSITLDDVKEVDALFFDSKRSAKILMEQESRFLV